MNNFQSFSLRLSDKESSVLEELTSAQEMSKHQLMRQALRLYQHVYLQTKRGHTMAFIDGDGNAIRQVIIGIGEIE